MNSERKFVNEKITAPKDVIREYYQITNEQSTEFSCLFCYKSYVKNVSRMCKHIVLCLEAPAEVKDVVLNVLTRTNLETNVRSDEPMDTSEKYRLWEKLARAIYISGAPFSMVEDENWIEFFHDLKPSFNLPTRKTLSTTLLDDEYNRSLAFTNSKIKDCSSYGVQIDSWTNIRYEPIVNILVTTPEPILYKSIYSQTEHHTGEYYAGRLKETILNCGKDRCLGICTDNEPTMVKARRLVLNDLEFADSPISGYGCIAHWENLLGADILKKQSCARIQKNVTSVITSINGSQILKERLKAIQSEKYGKVIALLLPVKTRWCYFVPSIQSLLKSRSAIEDLANCSEIRKNLSSEMKARITNDTFWIEAEQILFLLEPIKIWITRLEADKCVISQVPLAIKEISEHIEANLPFSPLSPQEEVEILDIVRNRATGIMTSIHYAANILDPTFQGKILTDAQKIEGFSYISKVSSALKCASTKIEEELHLYVNRKGFWASDVLWNFPLKDNPRIWWSTFCGASELSKIAISILSMPPTSAATERSFSTFSNIHTKKRNRLTTNRASKVVFIGKTHQIFSKRKRALKRKNENEIDEITYHNSEVGEFENFDDDSCCCLQCQPV